ncbi:MULTISPECIES: nitrate reductase molybdenum cofactor assembly chaperone [unclassified Kribbella]|uniref:nitrate reductase molybdenum cofactor assembly chaperone n=1 Tax=unclassified Kribbella TaxID=2644121 RepID=UPI0033F6AD20
MSRQTTAVAHKAASLLLAYPDEELFDRLPMITDALSTLPADVGAPLRSFAEHLAASTPAAAQRDYVATFDLRPRCCLYLTWWTHGDTRERGKALVGFKDIYRAAGLTPPDDELPDHLSVVLEFAATGDAKAGVALLTQHRAALELLKDALHRHRSPYAQLVETVLATLPPSGPDVLLAARRIAAEGPPQERVGLEPYPTGGPR